MLFQNFTSNQQTFPSYIVLILLCQRHYFITGITPPPKRPFEYITSGQNHLILVKSSTTPPNSFWYNHRRHARHVRHLHAPLQTLLPSSLLSPSSSSSSDDDDSSSCSENLCGWNHPRPCVVDAPRGYWHPQRWICGFRKIVIQTHGGNRNLLVSNDVIDPSKLPFRHRSPLPRPRDCQQLPARRPVHHLPGYGPSLDFSPSSWAVRPRLMSPRVNDNGLPRGGLRVRPEGWDVDRGDPGRDRLSVGFRAVWTRNTMEGPRSGRRPSPRSRSTPLRPPFHHSSPWDAFAGEYEKRVEPFLLRDAMLSFRENKTSWSSPRTQW